MSILLGVHSADGSAPSEETLQRRAMLTRRYAIGPEITCIKSGVGMVWQPYGCHSRFALEAGPVADQKGNVLSLDGRLDNFRELAHLLDLPVQSTSDSRIALAAYGRWGATCFGRLTGDWAVVIWSAQEDTVFLARDHAGTRTLHYRVRQNELEWATHLETFFSGTNTPALSEQYIAAYLSGGQIGELTPYKEILAVAPGCYITMCRGSVRIEQHWSPFGGSELEYAFDQEYREHFLTLFQQAVERRTENVPQVLAELSGGMDSTAIVCMSDHCRRPECGNALLLDTVSYFDDEEASLDERRYFSITEAVRGKVGVHLDMAFSQRTFLPHDSVRGRYLLPGADSISILREELFFDRVWSKGYLALLSGIGGDELLGGVPDRYPELADYLTAGRWWTLARQSLSWSVMNRDPIVATLIQTVRWTAASYRGRQNVTIPPSWMSSKARELAESRENGTRSYRELRHYTPRQLDNARTWAAIAETLPHRCPRIIARPEYRYPYLDKDLVNYLLRVPRAQLLRPGRRRAMMREALKGIVPEEILERKRKAFQIRGPLRVLQRRERELALLLDDSALIQGGFVEADDLAATLRRCCSGQPSDWQALIRAITLEIWLRSSDSTQNSAFRDPGLAA